MNVVHGHSVDETCMHEPCFHVVLLVATCTCTSRYRKFPIISLGLIFVQKAVFLGLFLGELIFGGAYYWKEFCVSKWVGLDNKTASTNSPWAYICEGLSSEGFLHLRFGGLIFGRAYFTFFFLEGGGGGDYYWNFTV